VLSVAEDIASDIEKPFSLRGSEISRLYLTSSSCIGIVPIVCAQQWPTWHFPTSIFSLIPLCYHLRVMYVAYSRTIPT
jgi:hypothetical protein